MGLLNNVENIEFRERLLTRNLYSPESIYDINNPKLVEAINLAGNIISPTSGFDITNTILGRALQIGPQTKLVQIANQELAKQFTMRVAKLAATEIIPNIEILNLFDGDPNSKLFTKKEDYDITSVAGKSRLSKFIEDITGTQTSKSPFNDRTTNSDLIRNTGSGQLNALVSNVSRNKYRPSDTQYIAALNSKDKEFTSIATTINDDKFISETDNKRYPNGTVVNELLQSNELELRTSTLGRSDSDEYGVSDESINDFGKNDVSTKLPNPESFDLVDPQYYGLNDSKSNQIIWGDPDSDLLNNTSNKFNVRKGLLLKTDALLKASGEKDSFIDQTKSRFVDKVNYNGGRPMYNGSPFRNYSKISQYDSYGKAIRFSGNSIYGGDVNSTIYKTIIPKIRPKSTDNTNLFFSIENLAYVINSNGDTGIPLIASGERTSSTRTLKVPKEEVGPNAGRQMWFMPYGVEFSENAIAKNEKVEFIGRGEPIYTYSNSERTGTLNFMLIIDYPPQVYGKDHNQIAEFYAKGTIGNQVKTYTDNDRSNAEAQKKKLIEQRDSIKPKTFDVEVRPDIPFERKEIYYFYPNDIPKPNDNLNTVIDDYITKGYEDGNNTNSDISEFGGDLGYNRTFVNDVNDIVKQITDSNTWKYYKATFYGAATLLYKNKRAIGKEYNEQLSERRIGALKSKINQVVSSINGGKKLSDLEVTIIDLPLGDQQGSPSGNDPINMYNPDIKTERYGKFILEYNGLVENVNVPEVLSAEDQNTIDTINRQIELIDKQIAEMKANPKVNDFEDRKASDRIPKGFQDVDTVNSKKKLVGTYHSYTPEDFHRRLTFLQQCVRQGSPVSKEYVTNEGIVTSKNSVFGRPPVCVLRLGDFLHTKIIIDNISIDYEQLWDINPEGMGAQPMIAKVSMSVKLIGGQSLGAPIDAIQNAESFNYYANSSFYNEDVYQYSKIYEKEQVDINVKAVKNRIESKQNSFNKGD